MPLENIVEKGENAGVQHFLLFPRCFLKEKGENAGHQHFFPFSHNVFSSPERAVSGVRRPSCVVNFLPCVRSRGHSFGRILMKVGQDVCLDEISDEFENGSCGVKN